MDQEKLKKFQALKRKQALSEGKLRIGLVCYYYPQYTLEDAKNMASGDAVYLINVARHEKALDQLDLVNAVAAGSNKKGYESLVTSIKKRMNSIIDKL